MGIIAGTEWEVIGGEIHGYISYYYLAGVEGAFNTALFDKSWRDHEELENLMEIKC